MKKFKEMGKSKKDNRKAMWKVKKKMGAKPEEKG